MDSLYPREHAPAHRMDQFEKIAANLYEQMKARGLCLIQERGVCSIPGRYWKSAPAVVQSIYVEEKHSGMEVLSFQAILRDRAALDQLFAIAMDDYFDAKEDFLDDATR